MRKKKKGLAGGVRTIAKGEQKTNKFLSGGAKEKLDS